MSDEKIQPPEEIEEKEGDDRRQTVPRPKFFTRRRILIAAAAILIVLGLAVTVSFRYGAFDRYVEGEFKAKLERMGIAYGAERFNLTFSPLRLEIRNAEFKDKITGERLFSIREADLGLTVRDLWSWQMSRDVNVDSTEIRGAEVWIRFDEQGRSNFSNVRLIEEETRVTVIYESVRVSMRDVVVRYGDSSRKISGDAENVSLRLDPEGDAEKSRYRFDLTSDRSNFVYDGRRLEPVDLRAEGVFDKNGAEITGLRIRTPIGESTLRGRIDNWQAPRYGLEIESTIDLTQTSDVFPTGTPLRGIGNFKGRVTGEGESYKVEGEVYSESLSASNVFLKGLNVNAVVEGRESAYEATGKAIAQMLTFGDFRIDNPAISGFIRGTGTDFRWLGELRAAAAKTKIGTIGGLYIADAVAEFREDRFSADAGRIRFDRYDFEDIRIDDVRTGNLKVASAGGVTDVSAPEVNAGRVRTEDIDLDGVTVDRLKVRDNPGSVDIRADRLRAKSGKTEDARLGNLEADGVTVTRKGRVTDIEARGLTAGTVETDDARIGGVTASGITVRDTDSEMVIYSDGLKVAKIDTDAAILGSLNIAGVRLTVRRGVIEGTSGDIDAGTVALRKTAELPDGGTLEKVRIAKPVFVLEPAGRYRATADMSLGGGVLGSITLGAAKAAVTVDNNSIALRDLDAEVMSGRVNGNATIARDRSRRSVIEGDFSNLDISKLLALQGGKLIPIEGRTTGTVSLSFPGTEARAASGRVEADIEASAGTTERGFVPLSGRVESTAVDGLFNLDIARLKTGKSSLEASGGLDLNGENSNLKLALASSDAAEVERILRVSGLSPDLEATIDEYSAEFGGRLSFDGVLTGSASTPTVEGRVELDRFLLRGRFLGSFEAGIFTSPEITEVRNGLLREADGGTLALDAAIPAEGENNIAVKARLERIDAGNILAGLPINLPETLRSIDADTSGDLDLRGLPDAMVGEANLRSTNGRIKGQSFDDLDVRLTFSGTLINLERFNAGFGEGKLVASGSYQTDSTAFDVTADAANIEFSRVRPLIPNAEELPEIGGTLKTKLRASGRSDDSTTWDVNFEGSGSDVTIRGNALGNIVFRGTTENRVFNADLTASLEGQDQKITARLDFSDPNLPLFAETNFNNSELAPFIALIRTPVESVALSGRATGRVYVEGNLSPAGGDGKRSLSADALAGRAEFIQFGLSINQTPLEAVQPVVIDFSTREVRIDSARFAGGGSNLVVAGTKALRDDGVNNFSVDGRINLSILNVASRNAFFAGLADVSMRLTGPQRTARLNGSADMQNASAAVFVGSERITFDRIRGRAIFTSNQVQLSELSGFLGGGRFTATGGMFLGDALLIEAFRLDLRGNDVTLPLPRNFQTTGDAEIQLNGRRTNGVLTSVVSGRINANRSIYSKNIDLADVIGGRQEGSIAQSDSGSTFGDIRLDLLVEGRDALVVRNNLADLSASLSLRVTGDIDFPQVAGRITASSGTLFYRSDRYEVRRGELVFPPNTDGIEPVVSLQAETEIGGYQIFVNLDGKLTDTENLRANVRSNPALPSNDVISLMTTGSLSNTETGIPTIATSGINTAAEILTDEIINKPVAKATDKLFGLNKFQLDPILSGQRLNPTARLTVGRQINRNLAVTYATNLSEDQNQVLALEYRVSNRLSFVAQYEQRSLSNVTRNKDSFSFEIRLRKRF